MIQGRQQIGSQIWLEPTDSPERIRTLCKEARDAGHGWLRVFLMWSWIEAQPSKWEWRIFDNVFDSAAEFGIKIKATLTANSGPWHVGTPAMLHTHTMFVSEEARQASVAYIANCVNRYKNHSALGQWILWNEPDGYRVDENNPPEKLAFWREFLREEYAGDIAALNHRWLTGYADFDEVPFADGILHHESGRWHNWCSYGPRLKEWRMKEKWLNHELQWVADQVKALDSTTELCVNPTAIHSNGAIGASNLGEIAQIVDIVGASYHPAWQFQFANRRDFAALMNTGVRLEYARAGVRRVEVTEVQTGNTLKSSNKPSDATADEVARYYLAALSAGAESVTGWCFNARSHDFEAGDWALLDNMDKPSSRSRVLGKLAQKLDEIQAITGAWQRANATVYVISDPKSHALEWIEDAVANTRIPGRMPHDGAHGAALLSVAVAAQGLPVDIVVWRDLPEDGAGKVVIVSHAIAIDAEDAQRLTRFVESGGHVLMDATSGHKNSNADLWRPWPAGLESVFGVRVVGLESNPTGWFVRYHNFAAANLIAARSRLALDANAQWAAVSGFRFAEDHEPLAYTRPYGAGRFTICRGVLGPSLVHSPDAAPLIQELLRHSLAAVSADVRPLVADAGVWATPIVTANGSLTLVCAPSVLQRAGRAVVLQVSAGNYRDLWSGESVTVDAAGELSIAAPDGVALLWRQ
jgi:beta-galactosidase GanA